MREICVELPRVAVTGKEGDQPVEYLLNSNSTVTLSLLHEDFPGVTGLRYLTSTKPTIVQERYIATRKPATQAPNRILIPGKLKTSLQFNGLQCRNKSQQLHTKSLL